MRLHNIRVVLLHSPEVKHPGDEQHDDHAYRDEHHRAWRTVTQERPAEPFDHARHRVEAIPDSQRCRHEAGCIYDRRCKHPDLDEEGDGVLEITILDVECREPETDPKRGCKREQEEERQEHDFERRNVAIVDHHREKDNKGDRKIDKWRDDTGERHDQSREVHFGHDVRVRDHACRGPGQPFGKECPWEQGCQHKQGIGHAIGRDVCQTSEKDREDDHGQERLEYRPCNPEAGLLVPEFDIAQGKRGD